MECKDIKDRKKVQLSPEDLARTTRLQEEIVGRIEEIARIHARNLNITPKFPVKEFTFIPSSAATAPQPVSGSLHIVYDDGSESCEQNPPGICCMGPCPCQVEILEQTM